MNKEDFIIETLFNMFKDKHFKNVSCLKCYLKRYTKDNKLLNEISLRIINYQVLKYGYQLATYNFYDKKESR